MLQPRAASINQAHTHTHRHTHRHRKRERETQFYCAYLVATGHLPQAKCNVQLPTVQCLQRSSPCETFNCQLHRPRFPFALYSFSCPSLSLSLSTASLLSPFLPLSLPLLFHLSSFPLLSVKVKSERSPADWQQ